jgi:hypothetical protein
MRGPRLDDPDLPLRLVFEHWPEVANIFRAQGMACFHTVIDACAEYGLDEIAFRAALQAAAAL